ncbi:MAG: glycerophosphodiester phosphodiesterase [Asgard group archaeon]|nr:glycerophosphodiester phosphodiesterase [Asgard group archaeon]
MKIPKIYGHRGASAVEPENTMRAFTRAFKDGAKGIEFDIRLTADKKIVVIHDDTLNRTSNGVGFVKDQTYDELLQLDFGLGEKIPLLKDVLKEYGNKYWLNIEIKELGFEQLLVDTLNEYNIKEKLIISSFKIPAIKIVKELDPKMHTAYIYSLNRPDLNKLKKTIKLDGIHPKKSLVTKQLVEEASSLNLPIRTWTVDKPKKAIKLAKLGIESIITNNPKVILQAFIEKKAIKKPLKRET